MPVDVQVGEGGTVTVTVDGLTKGLDSQSGPTKIAPNSTPDIQNMTTNGGYPAGMSGSTLHLAGFVAPDGAAPQDLAHYVPSTGPDVYVMACQNGHVYQSADGGATWASIRRGLTTGAAAWWSHKQIEDFLVMGNGTDPIFKYDGTRFIPLGAKTIADMEAAETWVGGAADAVNVKQGAQGRKLTATAGGTAAMTHTPATPWDLITGIGAARDYEATDYIDCWLYIDTAANLTLAASYLYLGNVAQTVYFQLYATGWGALVNGWNKIHVLKSAFGNTGGAVWSSIAKVMLFLDAEAGTNVSVTMDDCYMIYAEVMPPCQIIETLKGMLLGVTKSDVYYAPVGGPDQFDTVDTSVVVVDSADGTQITGMHPYGDYMLVTKEASVHSISVQFRNLLYPDYDMTRNRVTTQHGCTSHRSMVEGGGRVYMHWRNNIHAFAGIGTVKVSEIIDTTLADIEPSRLAFVVGGALADANQLYWWWTPLGGTQNTLGMAYNLVQQAWLPLVGRAVALAETVFEDNVSSLLTPDYTGRVLRQHAGATWDGDAITRYITTPWIAAGRPYPMVSWRGVKLSYQTETGTLLVDARTANHPREFPAAVYSTVASLDMSVSGNWGAVSTHLRSPWVQYRFRTVGAPVELYWPITITGLVQWSRG